MASELCFKVYDTKTRFVCFVSKGLLFYRIKKHHYHTVFLAYFYVVLNVAYIYDCNTAVLNIFFILDSYLV